MMAKQILNHQYFSIHDFYGIFSVLYIFFSPEKIQLNKKTHTHIFPSEITKEKNYKVKKATGGELLDRN